MIERGCEEMQLFMPWLPLLLLLPPPLLLFPCPFSSPRQHPPFFCRLDASLFNLLKRSAAAAAIVLKVGDH